MSSAQSSHHQERAPYALLAHVVGQQAGDDVADDAQVLRDAADVIRLLLIQPAQQQAEDHREHEAPPAVEYDAAAKEHGQAVDHQRQYHGGGDAPGLFHVKGQIAG